MDYDGAHYFLERPLKVLLLGDRSKTTTNSPVHRNSRWSLGFLSGRNLKYVTLALILLLGVARAASASEAYGSLNNFDCVNDTGFEIELEDGRSTDITYTYDWNHYGTPEIREDLTDPAHPKVFVRYASKKNPDGSWASYTAIPAGPVSPT